MIENYYPSVQDLEIGDEFEAYAKVYRDYVNELYSYAVSLGYSEGMAMDAIHDVFFKLVVSSKGLEDIGNVKFYLFRSIKNRLLDIQKHGRRITFDDMSKQDFRMDVSFADEMIISAEERHQIEIRVKKLMDELTPTQKEAIYLRYIQEMEYDEIADLLHINPESVRKLVHRGLDKLRQQNLGIIGFIIMLQILNSSNPA